MKTSITPHKILSRSTRQTSRQRQKSPRPRTKPRSQRPKQGASELPRFIVSRRVKLTPSCKLGGARHCRAGHIPRRGAESRGNLRAHLSESPGGISRMSAKGLSRRAVAPDKPGAPASISTARGRASTSLPRWARRMILIRSRRGGTFYLSGDDRLLIVAECLFYLQVFFFSLLFF